MTSIGHSLQIKYGLRQAPSEFDQSRWVNLVRQYINAGMDEEAAGSRAAQLVFSDYQTMLYKSEADTIVALLQAAERR